MTKLRCFIALDISDEMKNDLANAQEELKKKNLFEGKFTDKQHIHLTLKFLGGVDEKEIPKIKQQLRKVKFNSFEAKLGECGVFSEEFVRIIWSKLEGNEVTELQKKVDEALIDLFSKEDVFMSHITIARVKTTKFKEDLKKASKELKTIASGKIKSFSLMKSTLKPEGPVYEVIEKYNLD